MKLLSTQKINGVKQYTIKLENGSVVTISHSEYRYLKRAQKKQNSELNKEENNGNYFNSCNF